MRRKLLLLGATLSSALVMQGCERGRAENVDIRAAADSVPLYDNLGSYHRPVNTGIERAQAYFDQGLRLQYAFNHAEAIRSYEEAVRLDPGCAMCWWGIALALGPNINAPMDSASGARAFESIRRAEQLVAQGPASERALIGALIERYARVPTADRAPLDSAYANAMSVVAESFPNDPDALTLYAASLMNLSPWFYWTGDYGDREPRPATPTMLENLERAMSLNPDHPGACHYYIHSVEAAYPEKAVECAERLAGLMPGAGHIVHMPGHIYIRVGRYADAVKQNEHAVHADETYIQDQNPRGLYPAGYYPHNYHFMWFAATMAGMSEKAMHAARMVAPKVPLEVAREIYWIQNVLILPMLTSVTFGDWEGVLAAPMPPSELDNATATAHYARGIALAATGRQAEAEAESRAIREIARRIGATDHSEGPEVVVAIASHALAGEIALRTGDPEAAVGHLEAAARLEDGMVYEEPPVWYLPVRHTLGRALLEAGRAAEAEAAYREDLLRFPANGWSLAGLARALEAQGRNEEAAVVRDEQAEAWAHADVELTGSRI
ncbi:MAG: tetratricopeptide repeat protein [Gemmatimonadota bacterium]